MQKTKNNSFFWICGKHTVFEALKNPLRQIKEIVLLKNSKNQINQSISSKFKIIYENQNFFNHKFGTDLSHQGIAVCVKPIIFENVKEYIKKYNPTEIIALDGIHDPRNIGAIIRSAVSYNWNTILVNKKDFNNQSASLFKSASGGMEHINLIVSSNIFNDIKYLQKENFWVLGISSNSNNSLYQFKNLNKKVLIFGSENKGIRSYLEKFCNNTYKLPISKNINSLNVSCAVSSTLTIIDYIKKNPL